MLRSKPGLPSFSEAASDCSSVNHRIKAFHDAHNVLVFFPPESAEQSTVLLVYDPTSPSASPSPDEKARNLDDVEAELLKMARGAADVKAQTIPVEKKWHDAVVGKDGTTLNA